MSEARGPFRSAGTLEPARKCPYRSSADNPPRVGMVVRWARGPAYSCPVPPGRQFEISTDEKRAFDTIKAHDEEWNRGQYDIISEPPPRICEHDGCHLEGAIPCDGFMRAKRARRAAVVSGLAETSWAIQALCSRCNGASPTSNLCDKCRREIQEATACNCAQSLSLIDALRRIVAAVDSTHFMRTNVPRDRIDVLDEINRIAREALK